MSTLSDVRFFDNLPPGELGADTEAEGVTIKIPTAEWIALDAIARARGTKRTTFLRQIALKTASVLGPVNR